MPLKSEMIFFVSIAVILCVIAFQRNTVWANEVSLWHDIKNKAFLKDRPHNNLGLNYAKTGRFDEAILEFKLALKLNPGFPDAHNNLGNAYAVSGRLNEAIEEYKKHIGLNPNHLDTHYNLGVIYRSMGLINEARKEFEIVLKLKPDDTGAPQAIESLGR